MPSGPQSRRTGAVGYRLSWPRSCLTGRNRSLVLWAVRRVGDKVSMTVHNCEGVVTEERHDVGVDLGCRTISGRIVAMAWRPSVSVSSAASIFRMAMALRLRSPPQRTMSPMSPIAHSSSRLKPKIASPIHTQRSRPSPLCRPVLRDRRRYPQGAEVSHPPGRSGAVLRRSCGRLLGDQRPQAAIAAIARINRSYGPLRHLS